MRARTSVRAAALAAVAPSLIVGMTRQARADDTDPSGAVNVQSMPKAGTSKPIGGYCSTRMLTKTEMDADVRSVVTCSDSYAEALARNGVRVDPNSKPGEIYVDGLFTTRAIDLVAEHYDGSGAGGTQSLTVVGNSCGGGGISFNTGDWWNNKISSTRHWHCGTIKHWDANNYSGNADKTIGNYNEPVDLTFTSGLVSSIKYYEPYHSTPTS